MKILVVGWQALPDLELIPFLDRLGESDTADHPLIDGGVVWFWVKALRALGHEVRFFDHAWPRLLPRRDLVADPSLFRDVIIARRSDAMLRDRDAAAVNSELLDAVRSFRPDVLLTHQAERLSVSTIEEIRRTARTATWVGANPFNTSRFAWLESLAAYHHVFCAVKEIMPRLASPRTRTHFLSFAFDPDLHRPYGAEKRFDVGFVGSHKYPRRRMLRSLVAAAPGMRLGIWGREWPPDGLLDRCQQGFAWHDGVARAIDSMRVHVNIPHVSVGEAINMRVFETAGSGTPLLSLHQEGLLEHFQPDEEVVTYRDTAEMIAKAKMLVADPALAAHIGAAARRRALENYTYGHRLEDLLHSTVA